MIRHIFFVLLILCSVSCGNNDELPEAILKPEKMQAVLWDILKAEAYTAEMLKKDSSKNAIEENRKLQQQVFAIHKVTSDQFYKSYDHYKNDPASFKVMLDSMISRGGREKKPDTIPTTLQAQ